MTNDYCKQCVFWIMDNCRGLETEGKCPDLETYEDWDNLDSCIEH